MTGTQWCKLNTRQLGEARLVSLSLIEAGQVWAVDEAGQVYMRLGSLELPTPPAIPVWLALELEREVEEELGEGGWRVEVVCSSGGHMVSATQSGLWVSVGTSESWRSGRHRSLHHWTRTSV